MNYYYGMRLRGFSPGCQPNGVIDRIEPYGTFSDYHDIIVYLQPLSDEQRERYSLDYLGRGDSLENAQAKALGSFIGKRFGMRL